MSSWTRFSCEIDVPINVSSSYQNVEYDMLCYGKTKSLHDFVRLTAMEWNQTKSEVNIMEMIIVNE